MEQLASAQSQMERALRDKVAALNDLENAKLQIKRYDQEVSLVSWCIIMWNELCHGKRAALAYANSSDSDEPGHPGSLTRTSAVCSHKK